MCTPVPSLDVLVMGVVHYLDPATERKDMSVLHRTTPGGKAVHQGGALSRVMERL